MIKANKKVIVISIVAFVFCIVTLIGIILGVQISKIKLQKQRAAELEAKNAYRNAKFAVYQTENDLYDDYQVDVAFLGDSLTYWYNLQQYYPQYVTVNRGIGGDTTFDLQNRLQLSLFDLKPKVAVMLIGANNFETMMTNYEDILYSIKQNLPDTKVVILSLTSMSGEVWGVKNQIAAYNNVIIEKLADKYGFEFIDLYSTLLNVETGEIYEGYTIDGCHFTPIGYAKITEIITPVLDKLLS